MKLLRCLVDRTAWFKYNYLLQPLDSIIGSSLVSVKLDRSPMLLFLGTIGRIQSKGHFNVRRFDSLNSSEQRRWCLRAWRILDLYQIS